MNYAGALQLAGGKHKANPWLHRLSILTAAATVFLIAAGATVTSTGSGDAVPDWPLSYGTLFPPMMGGVIIEHSHRLIAGCTALLITALAIWLWRSDNALWLKRLGFVAFVGVLLQATMGGLRVLVVSNEKIQSTAVAVTGAPHVEPVRVGFAVTHAALAQIVLCLAFAIALFTSQAWEIGKLGNWEIGSLAPCGRLCGRLLAWAATCTTALVFIQLLLGALMRHTQAGLILPGFPSFNAEPHNPNAPFPMTYVEWQFKVAVHFAHRITALLIASAVGTTTFLVWRHFRRVAPLTQLASLLLLMVFAQITLGAFAIWTELAVPVTVAHVSTGASILGFSVLMTIWSWRVTATQEGRGKRGKEGERGVNSSCFPFLPLPSP